MRNTLIVVLLLVTTNLFAQIIIEHPQSESAKAYEDLIRKTLIGNGVLTGSIRVNAPSGCLGTFSITSSEDLVKEGIVISTGRIDSIPGPNTSTGSGTNEMGIGDRDLTNLIGRLTGDAVSIEFDFIPFNDSIVFNYFFASEEYPEYVGKGFNDAFAFLISGPGYPLKKNIAYLRLHETEYPITIDNVNFIQNKDYFITNHLKKDVSKLPRSVRPYLGEPKMTQLMSFDGMTTKLRAFARVTPYEVYTLKIVIADVGDLIYDSAVFLEKESFSTPIDKTPLDTIALLGVMNDFYRNDPEKQIELKDIYKTHIKKEMWVTDSIVSLVYFKSDSFSLSKLALRRMDSIIALVDVADIISLNLDGHTDNTNTRQYNEQLSKKRVHRVSSYFFKNGFQKQSVDWHSFDQPVATNDSENGKSLNRRVEIKLVFRKKLTVK